jgi:hypothetical protein
MLPILGSFSAVQSSCVWLQELETARKAVFRFYAVRGKCNDPAAAA